MSLILTSTNYLQQSLDIAVTGFSPSPFIPNPRFLQSKLSIEKKHRCSRLVLSNSDDDEAADDNANKKKAQKEDLTKMTAETEFPQNFIRYINYLENALETTIKIVSVGPDRAQTIHR